MKLNLSDLDEALRLIRSHGQRSDPTQEFKALVHIHVHIGPQDSNGPEPKYECETIDIADGSEATEAPEK